MEWDRLRIFYTVAAAGSFTKATETLNISQSAISRQVSLLEKELQSSLFKRTSKGLSLTEAGILLNQTFESVSAKIDVVKVNLVRLKTEIAGRIRILTSHDIGMLWLSAKIQKFLSLYSDVHIELILQEENEINPRNMDIGIFSSKVSLSGLAAINPIVYEKRLYASQGYLNECGIPLSVDDLDRHRLIVFSSENSPHFYNNIDWLLTVGAKKTRVPAVVINNVYGLCEIIKSGAGIGCLDKYTAIKHNLIEVLQHEKKPDSYCHLYYPTHLKDLKRIQVFVEFLETEMSERNFQ